MFKEYFAYLKDNPERYWFKAKLYGWGWTPATWQGWVTLLVYIVLILGLIVSREESVPGDPMSGSNFLVFALPILILTTVLIYICYKTGEKPHWQWGPKDTKLRDTPRE